MRALAAIFHAMTLNNSSDAEDSRHLSHVAGKHQKARDKMLKAEADLADRVARKEPEDGYKTRQWQPPSDWGRIVERAGPWPSTKFRAPFERITFENGKTVNRFVIDIVGFID